MNQISRLKVPIHWFLGQHLAQDRNHRIAKICSEKPWIVGHLGAVHQKFLESGSLRKGWLPGQQKIKSTTERVDVATNIRFSWVVRLLRRYIVKSSERNTAGRKIVC